jgi:hypothetical protein
MNRLPSGVFLIPREDRTEADNTAWADPFVLVIEAQVGDLADGTVPTGFKFRDSSADLGRMAVHDVQRHVMVEPPTIFLVGHRRFLSGGVKHFQESLDDPRF